jgi:phage tail protein X
MASADRLKARQGDTVDALIWRERGLTSADLPAVIALNPGLAALGPVLPTGTIVALPATPPAATTAPLVNLWD